MLIFYLLSIVVVILCAFPIWFDFMKYNKSTYKKETGNKYRQVRLNTGLNGEYLTSNMLDKIKGHHKTLLNCYLPNTRGQLTEIDLIFLHETGIYVLESKNYSGWIFGREEDKNWTQTFPNGKKQSFYNPIKQNKTHLNALKKYLSEISEESFQSIIVFSERCELKKITVDSKDVHVIQRNDLKRLLNRLIKERKNVFTPAEIDLIYESLKAHTQVDEQTKQEHIERVKQYKN